MNIVLDSCALLFWTHEPGRLSSKAANILNHLDKDDTARVVSATFWEIAIKVRAGRLELGMTPEAYLSRVSCLPIAIEAVDASLWLESANLDWSHRDPVDRLVVALARRHGAELLTSDQAIRAFFPQSAW